MANLSKLKKSLTVHEGKRNFPYKDTVGKLTIGIGRNLDDRGLSDAEINFLLKNDMNMCIIQVRNNFSFFDKMDDVRQNVLIEMVFNMGIGTVRKFVRTLQAMSDGDYKRASRGMRRSKWARQVGNRAKVLAEMMEKGEWPKEKHYR